MNIQTCMIATFAMASLATGALADSITLKGSVRMPTDGSPLLLQDVAILDGDDAQHFAELTVPIEADLHEAVEIHVDVIEQLLAEEGVNWARIALSGGAVVVRPRINASVTVGLNTQVERGEVSEPQSGKSLAVGGGGSSESSRFRHIDDWQREGEHLGRIAEIIRAEWKEEASRLHLAIDLSKLTELPAHATRIEVEARGSSRGTDWIDVQFRALRGETSFRPTKTVLVRVDLRVMRETTVALNRLTARRTLKLDDLSTAPRLIKPSDAARSLTPESLVGRRLSRRVEEGGAVLSSFLQAEVVVRRNDPVHVVMRGPFQLTGSEAMALERGAVGERINCRWRAGDEPFTALVIGPGEVRAGG